RKQTIISSILIYIGFGIGFINIYLYTKNGYFTLGQYALTQIFFDFAQIMFAFGAMGVVPVIYKFYPYYKDNLPKKQIDLLTWAMVIAVSGVILIWIAGWIMEPFFIRKFIKNSPLILDYYYWLFPFTAGMLFWSVLESYSWAVQKSIMSNFLKETGMRIITVLLLVLFCLRIITFTQFIYFFSVQYLAIFLLLLLYLYKTGNLHFSFKISRVTRKYWKKMLNMQALVWSGTIIATIAAAIDSLFIASLIGLTATGVFTFGRYAANLIQVPMRSIIAISASVISQAWKEKNYREINRIYYRSSINLLLISLFIFGNIWLNVNDGIKLLNIQEKYLDAMRVLFMLCVVRVVDAGTGLNSLVISTSTYWRFDFISSVCLLALRLPVTYYLIKRFGIIGSAYAELMSVTFINLVRYEFLRRKFGMQPFRIQTLYAVLLAFAAYFTCHFAFGNMHNWTGIFLRVTVFTAIMGGGILYGKLTPDAGQMIEVFMRWARRKD
ncbi:MAG TPA: polysaccharide biosynthesis C-terminal domain-containing protein, partial [Sediminibacterium sp.]